MLGDEFRAKYRLNKRLTQRPIRSYQAIDPDGNEVMVHVLGVQPIKAQTLLALFEQLGPADKAKVVETIEVEGTQVVVTQVLEDFETLPGWLKDRAQIRETEAESGDFTHLFRTARQEEGAEPEEAPPVEAEAEQTPSGEFTGLFGLRKEAPESAPLPAEAPPEVEAAAQAEPEPELGPEPELEPEPEPLPEPEPAGEFTGLFGPSTEAVEADQLEEPVLSEPEVAAPAEPEAEPSRPSEFTRLFGPRSEALEESPKEPKPAAEEPEKKRPVIRWREGAPAETGPRVKPVVQWKKGPQKGEAPPAEPPLAPPAAPDVETTGGDFTKLFRGAAGSPQQPPDVQAGPPAGPAPAKSPLDRSTGDYLRALGASTPIEDHAQAPSPVEPPSMVPPSAVPPVDAPPSAPPPPLKDGPSAYTLIVSGDISQPPGAAASGVQPEEDQPLAPRAPSLRFLFIGLGAIVAAILILVILFALL
jgi:hypothetical protein